MDGGKRRRGRFDSDLAGAYGAGALTLPHETQVGLWLNLPRARLRLADAFALGLQLADGRTETGRAYAEAVSATDAEAEELLFRLRERAREARAMRRWGF